MKHSTPTPGNGTAPIRLWPRELPRFAAAVEGEAFGVVVDGTDAADRVATWSEIDARTDVLLDDIRRLLAQVRARTSCPVARRGIAVALGRLSIYAEGDTAEDEHVRAAGVGISNAVGHGRAIVGLAEGVLSTRMVGVIAAEVERARVGETDGGAA
jgi:hypothetical protein